MKRGRHNGHTLFEILLALGLSLVLLVAVYAALDMHWKYAAAGREEMERLQLTRALIDKLNLDIRSIVYRERDDTAATANEPNSSPPFGLIGDSDQLRLQVGSPSRNRLRSLGRNASVGEMDTRGLRLVSWQMIGEAADRLPGDGNSSNSFVPDGKLRGLSRMETSRLSSGVIDDDLHSSPKKSPGAILAEEVTEMGLRYFDGVTWHNAWDTPAKGRLPRAVEVTIKFRPLPARVVESDEQDNVDTQRVVIAVPLSEPPPAGKER
jgi:hypothetical protein